MRNSILSWPGDALASWIACRSVDGPESAELRTTIVRPGEVSVSVPEDCAAHGDTPAQTSSIRTAESPGRERRAKRRPRIAFGVESRFIVGSRNDCARTRLPVGVRGLVIAKTDPSTCPARSVHGRVRAKLDESRTGEPRCTWQSRRPVSITRSTGHRPGMGSAFKKVRVGPWRRFRRRPRQQCEV